MSERHENNLKDVRNALEANIQELKKENETYKNENQFLNHTKIDNESIIKELNQRVDGLDRQNTANVNELNSLRSSVHQLTKEKHSTELKLAESLVTADS